MSKEDIVRKLTSRKFWAAVVMGCGCVVAGMGGYVDGATSLRSALLTVVAYFVAEGAPDFARLIANSTKTTIMASSTARETVEKAINGEPREE